MCASYLAMLCLLAAPYRAADDKGTTPALRPDVAVVGEGGANAPRRFALVVGIDRYGDYSSLGNLRGCVADAQAISKVLVERCGYAAERVVALTDTQFRVPIRRRIESLFQGLKPEDVVLFYFSGHGMRGPDGQDYLVPLDGDPNDPSHTMLSTQEVRELLRKSGAGQILMVMDCCRNTADGRAASARGFGERSVAAEKDARDLVVFQSCGPDEVSHELPDSNRGAYSSYLEEGLSGQADANGDGLVTVAELQTYVRDHVSDWARQHKTVQVPAVSLTDVGDPIRTAGIVVARVAPRGTEPRPRPEEPAKPTTGSLVISVAPVEAEVQVGNQPAQRTQGGALTVPGLPAGDLNVVVRAQGYQDETRGVRIEAGLPVLLAVTLRPIVQPPAAPPPAPAAPAGSGTQAGQVKTIALPGGATMDLVWVPGGSFMMGDNQGYPDERPAHRVELEGFWIGKTAVTVGQWRSVMGLPAPDKDAGDDSPVTDVSWDDASAFCDRAGLRLPAEAQWEYAARGPEGRVYPWGNEWDASKAGVPSVEFRSCPAGVSWCGALDMVYSLCQWCEDWYDEHFYASPEASRPNPECANGRSGNRVFRGGTWGYFVLNSRSARRQSATPVTRYANLSFRAAQTR